MPLAKKILIAIAAIIVLSILSAGIAYKLIDDSFIENQALEALRKTLNRDVNVHGEFTLTRSLHPTLRTTDVQIASADWDTGNDLLTAQTIEIGIALLDLFRGVITIQDLVFTDAILNLTRNSQGQSNLEFSPVEPDTKNEKRRVTAAVDVINVTISNLILNYTDLQSENAFIYALDSFSLDPKSKEKISLSATSRLDEQPIIIESDMCRIRHLLKGEDCSIVADISKLPFQSNVKGTINIAEQGNLNLSIKSNADNINNLALFKDLSLPDTNDINIETELVGSFDRMSLNNMSASIELEGTDIKANGAIQSINSLEGFDVSISANAEQPTWLDDYQQFIASRFIDKFTAELSIQGDINTLQANNITSELQIEDTKITTTGNATINPELNLALKIAAKGKHPAWLNELQQVISAEEVDDFTIQAEITRENNILRIKQLITEAIINNTKTGANGEIQILPENELNIDLAIKSSGNNLQDFEKVFKQALPESKSFSLDTQFKLSDNIINLDDLALNIDKTQLQGASEIELTSPPNIRAQLSASTLNVEHMLATFTKEKDAKEEKDQNENTSLFSDELIDLDWLNTADTDVSLSINNLIYKDAKLKDIAVTISAKNSLASIDLSSLKYDGANLTAQAQINASDNTYSHKLLTEGFNIGKLLSEIDASKTIQGKIDASVDIQSIGKTSKQIADNATGKFTIVMTEGSLANAPIDLLASNLLVELMPGKPSKDQTRIECLFIQFSGENGVFNSDAVLLNTENIVMTTNGSVDLTNEELNLLLIPKPKNIELFTLDANIRVSGAIIDPSFSLDKGTVFKKLLKSAATVALGPATLAVPFAGMGGDKTEKCFNEVAIATTKAVEAEQEAERLAREKAEQEKLEESKKDAVVEPLQFEE